MDHSASHRTRRDAVRLLALSALALPAALRPGAVDASVRWCRTDPGLLIGDRKAYFGLASPAAMKTAAKGAIGLIVHIPTGNPLHVELLHPDDNGFGFNYSLQEVRQSPDLDNNGDRVNIIVEVYAPAVDSTLPVKVEVGPGDPNGVATARKGGGKHNAQSSATRSARGKANEWISVGPVTI